MVSGTLAKTSATCLLNFESDMLDDNLTTLCIGSGNALMKCNPCRPDCHLRMGYYLTVDDNSASFQVDCHRTSGNTTDRNVDNQQQYLNN